MIVHLSSEPLVRPPIMHRAVAVVALSIAVALAIPAPGDAHPMPQSLVLLDFRSDGLDAELRLPADRLEIGFGRRLTGSIAASAVRFAMVF